MLKVFESLSLDGYFSDGSPDTGWAHGQEDAEWTSFVSDNASSGGALLFGRATYQLMAGFWPTAQAKRQLPEVAKGMNAAQKYVLSRKMKKAEWQNTKVLGHLDDVKGKDLVVLGSGSVVAQLTDLGLVDEYQLVLVPTVLGSGRSLFEGVKKPVDLKLTRSRAFKNGNVVLWYERR